MICYPATWGHDVLHAAKKSTEWKTATLLQPLTAGHRGRKSQVIHEESKLWGTNTTLGPGVPHQFVGHRTCDVSEPRERMTQHVRGTIDEVNASEL